MVAPMTIHPIFNAGLNSDDYDGDEFNGAGTNWPVSPVYFDSFEALSPVILTKEMLDAFEQCADLIFPCPENYVHFSARRDTEVPLAASALVAVHQTANQQTIPSEARVRHVGTPSREFALKATGRNLMISRTVNTEKPPAQTKNTKLTEPSNVLGFPRQNLTKRIGASNRTVVTKSSSPGLTVKREVRTEYLRKWR